MSPREYPVMRRLENIQIFSHVRSSRHKTSNPYTRMRRRACTLVAVLAIMFIINTVKAEPLTPALEQTIKSLEELSAEGINVTTYIDQLNRALELYRANKTEDADELVARTLVQLQQLSAQLPQYRLVKWVSVILQIAVLAALPPLFYYFFPRVYALAWAYARRKWIARRVRGRDTG